MLVVSVDVKSFTWTAQPTISIHWHFVVNSHRFIVVSILFGLAPLLVGCGRGTSVDRLPVHGTVTLADGGMFNGSITFLPANGRPGPAATMLVADGSYKFDRNNGPTAGAQTVIMKRIVPRSRIPEKKEIVQKGKKAFQKTQGEWTLSADILDDGQYLQDFTLKD